MSEVRKPIAKGNLRLSKSKKAVMIYVEGQQPLMVSRKSLVKLLGEETPYVKIWSVESDGRETDNEKTDSRHSIDK